MTGYTSTPDYYNDYIAHWRPAGWTKKDHKYISRKKGKNGKWQYIYETAKSKVRKVTNKIDSDHDWIIDVFDRNIKKPSSAIKNDPRYSKPESEESAMNGDPRYSKKTYNDLINPKRSTEKVYKYYKRIKLADDKYRYFYSAEEYERYSKRISVLDKDYQFMQDVPVLSKKPTAYDTVLKTDVGTDNGNCTSCATAFELRMRGYDVRSRDDIDGASPDDYIEKSFKNATTSGIDHRWYLNTSREENKDFYTKKGFLGGIKRATTNSEKLEIAQNDLERSIKEKGGDNQRGFITIGWTNTGSNNGRAKAGGGHVFNYVVTDGKVKYYDAQKDDSNRQMGQEIDIKDYLDKTDYTYHSAIYNDDKSIKSYRTYMGFCRIDDKEMTENTKNYISYTPEEIHDTPEETKRRIVR